MYEFHIPERKGGKRIRCDSVEERGVYMPNKKRKNLQEMNAPKFVYRYMSVDELKKVLAGEILVNTTNFQKAGYNSGSVGFCFLERGFKSYWSDGTILCPSVEDFRQDWELIAAYRFYKESKNCSEKAFRGYIRKHVLVEFINNGHVFEDSYGLYKGLGCVPELCTNQYSVQTLVPKRFATLNRYYDFKWHRICNFK